MSTQLVSFDQINEYQNLDVDKQCPFWTLNMKDEVVVKDWICSNWDTLHQADHGRRQAMIANLAAYKGIHYRVQDTRSKEIEYVSSYRKPRVIVNFSQGYIEQQVARLTKYRPATNAVPASDDYDDVVTARNWDDVQKAIWVDNDIDGWLQRSQRFCRIFGEAFLEPYFDQNAGPLDPDYEKAKAKSTDGRVKLIGEDGKQVVGENDEPLYIDRDVKLGEVRYRLEYSWNIQFQPVASKKYEDTEWAIRREFMDVDDAKARWPEKSSKIEESTGSSQIFDTDTLEDISSGRKIEVFHLYHRSTDRLSKGAYVVVTRSGIMQQDALPEEYYGDYPWCRLIDTEYPGSIRGYAKLEQGRPIQGLYNNLQSLLVKSIFYGAHPKWMMPENAAKLESLGNDQTVVQYKGATPPQLVSFNPISPAVLTGLEKTKADLQEVMAITGLSMGQPPPGIKAGIAIQYLDEKDNERSNADIARHNEFIKAVALKTARVVSVKYQDHEQYRLERILGKSRMGDIKGFSVKNFADIANIHIQAASALPQTKSARTQWILDVSDKYPNLMPEEQVVDLLDLGQDEKFKNETTAAVRKADKENMEWLRSGKIPSPEKYENHIVHYKKHVVMANDNTFADVTSEKAKGNFVDHIKATELEMYQICQRNPMYYEQVMRLFPYFPIYMDKDLVDAVSGPAVNPETMQIQAASQAMQQQGMPIAPGSPDKPMDMTGQFMPGQENKAPVAEQGMVAEAPMPAIDEVRPGL